jgi:hypothetical protein
MQSGTQPRGRTPGCAAVPYGENPGDGRLGTRPSRARRDEPADQLHGALGSTISSEVIADTKGVLRRVIGNGLASRLGKEERLKELIHTFDKAPAGSHRA